MTGSYFASVDAVTAVELSEAVLELSVLLWLLDEPALSDGSGLRESVTYHPDPLNTTPTG